MRGLLFVVLVVGIAEPQIRQHSIVPTLFPFNNRLLLGNSGQKTDKYGCFKKSKVQTF